MILWVLYDIVDDKARSRVAKYCKQAGLYRVQYSAFLGQLDPEARDVLQLQLEDCLDPDTDRVYMFPMSRDELRDTVLMGQAFDKKMISSEVRALFL